MSLETQEIFKRDGEQMAQERGHEIGAWRDGFQLGIAACIHCGATVALRITPRTAEIGGKALGRDCDRTRKEETTAQSSGEAA